MLLAVTLFICRFWCWMFFYQALDSVTTFFFNVGFNIGCIYIKYYRYNKDRLSLYCLSVDHLTLCSHSI